jgi:hypothetical protein
MGYYASNANGDYDGYGSDGSDGGDEENGP